VTSEPLSSWLSATPGSLSGTSAAFASTALAEPKAGGAVSQRLRFDAVTESGHAVMRAVGMWHWS